MKYWGRALGRLGGAWAAISILRDVCALAAEVVDVQEAVVAVGDERRFRCSGTLIHRRAVLTARHCMPATRVAFGVDSRAPLSVSRVAQVQVPRQAYLDAALLILGEPVAEEQVIVPWRSGSDGRAPGGEVLLVGYGAMPPQRYGTRRALEVPVAGWGCDLLRSRVVGCEPGTELVLPRLRGTDTCDGDSGGPVLEEAEGRWQILAITSRPIAQYRLRCGDGGVYVRADALAPWIEKVLAQLNDQAASKEKQRR